MLILKNTRTYYTKAWYHRIIMESLRKKVDEIILQEHPVKVNLRKLPDDVETIVEAGDDDGDDDDDRGGGRLPTMKETLDNWHREQNEIYEGEDEEEEEESDKGSAYLWVDRKMNLTMMMKLLLHLQFHLKAQMNLN